MAVKKFFIIFCFFLCFGQLIDSEKPPNSEDPSDASNKVDLTPSFAPGTFVRRTGEDTSPLISKGDPRQEDSTAAGELPKGTPANRDDLQQQPPLSADDLPKDQPEQKLPDTDPLEKEPEDIEATNSNNAQGYLSQVLSNLAAPLFEDDEQDFLEDERNEPDVIGTEDQRADVVSSEGKSDETEEPSDERVEKNNERVTSHTEKSTTEAPDQEPVRQGIEVEDPDSDNNQGTQSTRGNDGAVERGISHQEEGLSKGSIEGEEEVRESEDGGSPSLGEETESGTLKEEPKVVEAAVKRQFVEETTKTSGQHMALDRSHGEEKLVKGGSDYQEHRLSDEDVEHLRVKKNKITEVKEEMRNQPLKEGTMKNEDEKSEITIEGEQEAKESNFGRLGVNDNKGNQGIETQEGEPSPEMRTTEDEKRRRNEALQRRVENLKQEKLRLVEQERLRKEEERKKDQEASKRREVETMKQEGERARMKENKRRLDEIKMERENMRTMKENQEKERLGEERGMQGEKRERESRRDVESTKEDETTAKWPRLQVKKDQLRRDRVNVNTVTMEGPNNMNKEMQNADQVKLERKMEDRAEIPEKDKLADETRTVEKQEGLEDLEREEMKMKGEVDKRLAEEGELKRRLEILNEERRNFEKLANEYRIGKASRQKMKQTKENVEAQTSKERKGQASPSRENEKQIAKEMESTTQDSEQEEKQAMFRELLKVIPRDELHKYRAVCQMVEVPQRSSCGTALTQKECHEEGCCFDNSIPEAVTCFFAPSPPVNDNQETQRTQEARKEVTDKSKHPNTAFSPESTLKHVVSKTVQSPAHSAPEDPRQFQVDSGSHQKRPSVLKNVREEEEGVKTSNDMPSATHDGSGFKSQNVVPSTDKASIETSPDTSEEGAYKNDPFVQETSTQPIHRTTTVREEMQRNFNMIEPKPVETQSTQDANEEHLTNKDLNKEGGDIQDSYHENENEEVISISASHFNPEKPSCPKGYCDAKPDLASLVSRFKQVEKQMNKVKLGETQFENSGRNASQVNETTAYAGFLRSFRGFHETSARLLLSYWPVVRNVTSDLLGCIGLDRVFDQLCDDLADVHPAVLFSTFLFGTIGVFYFLWSLTIGKMKHSAQGPNPRDVLNSYEARVRILEEEVQSLEMDKLRLQAERNDVTKEKIVLEDELKGTSEKIEKTVKMIKKLEDEKQKLIAAVGELRVSVQEKVTEINNKGEDIERFQGMVSELEQKVESREDEIRKLNEALQRKVEEKEAETRHVENLNEKIMQSMSENEKLEESLKEAKEKYNALQGDFDDQRLHVNELQQQYEFKCNEVEVLKDCLKQIKHTNADDSEETEVDAEVMQKRLQDLMDTAKAKADLTKVEESNHKMSDELEEYRKTVKELNETVEVMNEDLQMAKSKSQEASLLQREKEIELEALQKYFKATEVDLHRKLNAEEAARISSESELQSERAKQSTAAEDADNYRQLYLKLVKETEEINKERKLQLLDADQRAHDNFISYRKTLRDLETLRDECDMLRKRLYEAEMWKSRPSSSASSTFNHVDGHSGSPARGSPSSVPVVSGSPLHFVQQMMPSNPPPPPPPAPSSMFNSRPLPHPAEILGMAQPPPPLPPAPHVHPATRGYTTPPPTTGPPPPQPPKDKRPSIQDPRDRPPHPTPPPVSGPPPTGYGAPLPGMVRMYHPSAVRPPGPPLPNAQYSPMFMPRPTGPNPPPPPLPSGARPKATSTPNRS